MIGSDLPNLYRLSRLLRRARLYAPLYRAYRHLQNAMPRARGEAAKFEAARIAIAGALDGLPAAAAEAQRRVLIAGWSTFGGIAMQLPIVAAFIRAGYRPVVVLATRADKAACDLYRMAGVDDFAFWTELQPSAAAAARTAAVELNDQSDMLAVEQDGIRIGRYALSTMMRNLRRGRFDLAQSAERKAAATWLLRSDDAVAFAKTLMAAWKPDALLLDDRGYIPLGELFELAIRQGIPAFTWNAAHRDSTIMIKRYDTCNMDEHPTSLADESWATLCKKPWDDRIWHRVKDEIVDCYRSGQWYGEVGTQFGKTLLDRETVLQRLNLDPSKKTVLVFPHIFWDGTFFWGSDLFSDYEVFFTETLKVAYESPNVNWIIKVHPANLVKNRRDGVESRPGEWQVIESLGALPANIHVLDASTDISTLSLFEVGDICVTVRGTVGLEAACFGLTTITAGTGRYDQLGFTIDPQTPDEFRSLLRRADTIERPSAAAIQLAQRYAYGVLIERPVRYRCLRFGFNHDAVASTRVEYDHDGLLLESAEVLAMADYIRSGRQDFIQTSGP